MGYFWDDVLGGEVEYCDVEYWYYVDLVVVEQMGEFGVVVEQGGCYQDQDYVDYVDVDEFFVFVDGVQFQVQYVGGWNEEQYVVQGWVDIEEGVEDFVVVVYVGDQCVDVVDCYGQEDCLGVEGVDIVLGKVV